ncbi:hypothetical protein [Amycolatopsis orientalis]|uniref:hypothetical protein n=1 Tax=Amycolatopsis orientalis TaxID=31958 RepID=UPI0003FC24B8|nr:hypothetical protein [Amycolatopsis orientalis]
MVDTLVLRWTVTVVLLFSLAVMAFGFTRRTLRLAMPLIVSAVGLLWVPGLPDLLARWQWAILGLVAIVGLDWIAAWRGSPGVDVAKPVEFDTPATKELLTELGFRLPAVALRKPAGVPGGTSGDQVATIVSASEVKGGTLVAALIRLAELFTASPRRYVVRLRAERCADFDSVLTDEVATDPLLWVTVDVRSRRTDSSVAVTTFDRVRLSDAGEHAAAFVAAAVLARDRSTPRWILPVRERAEDLAQFLLGPPAPAAGATYEQVVADRRIRRDRLASVARDGAAAGIVRYELAMLDDLCGLPLAALRLHARTVAENPRFRRAQYRLGLSLVMAAGDALASCWLPDRNDREHRDIVTYLRRAGMSLAPTARSDAPEDLCRFRHALLVHAERQLTDYRAALTWPKMIASCLWRRSERSSWLTLMKSWSEWRRQVAVAESALLFCRARNRQIDGGVADSVFVRQARDQADRLCARIGGTDQWQHAYNLACTLTLTVADRDHAPAPERKADLARVLDLLRLVADAPDNPLASEWIGRDPDLKPLHADPRFRDFLRDQIRRDFPRSTPPGDEPEDVDWFAWQVDVAREGRRG